MMVIVVDDHIQGGEGGRGGCLVLRSAGINGYYGHCYGHARHVNWSGDCRLKIYDGREVVLNMATLGAKVMLLVMCATTALRLLSQEGGRDGGDDSSAVVRDDANDQGKGDCANVTTMTTMSMSGTMLLMVMFTLVVTMTTGS